MNQNKQITVSINRSTVNKVQKFDDTGAMLAWNVDDLHRECLINQFDMVTVNSIDWAATRRFSKASTAGHVNSAEFLNWAQWNDYNKRFRPMRMTIRQLLIEIYHGYAFASVFTRNWRRKDKFLHAQVLGFDFDANGLDEIAPLDIVKDHAAFVYSTPSSTPDNPRCRVVFVTESPLTSVEDFEAATQAIAHEFSQLGYNLDAACTDCTRLFYGSKDCAVFTPWHVLTDATRHEYTTRHAAHVKAEQAKTITITTGKATPDYAQRELKRVMNWLLNRDHEKHSRHASVYVAGRSISPFIKAKVLTEKQALKALTAVLDAWIDAHLDKSRTDEMERTFKDGIIKGSDKPAAKTYRVRSVSAMVRE